MGVLVLIELAFRSLTTRCSKADEEKYGSPNAN